MNNGVINNNQNQNNNTVLSATNNSSTANDTNVQNVQQQPQIINQYPQQQVLEQPIVSTQNSSQANSKNVQSKKINLTLILFIIIIGLAIYIFYLQKNYKVNIANLNYECSPIISTDKKELDLNSTLVKDLYSRVVTNIREDLAQPEFNDNMRLYLAYRQVLDNDKYDSNCNLFSNLLMEPYTCEVSTNFRPKAFKEETMYQAIKKMYGEKTNIPLANIQLGKSCIVGYQYIAARGEFVQGFCNQQTATSYKVTKKLVSAVSTRKTIVLKEEVKYHENEGLYLPATLKSGNYYYTFRFDMNYNYVLVNKTFESKY